MNAGGAPLASEPAGGPVAPHLDVVREPNQVAQYRAVPADAPTHSLVRAASWWVDDLLLPTGWNSARPGAERRAPVGTEGDPNFASGGDRVRYELTLDGAGPLRVEVELLSQVPGARWAAVLFQYETPAVEALRGMTDGAAPQPERVARASWPL